MTEWDDIGGSLDHYEWMIIDGTNYPREQILKSPQLLKRANQYWNALHRGIDFGLAGNSTDSKEFAEHLQGIRDPHLQKQFRDGVEDGYGDYQLIQKRKNK